MLHSFSNRSRFTRILAGNLKQLEKLGSVPNYPPNYPELPGSVPSYPELSHLKNRPASAISVP